MPNRVLKDSICTSDTIDQLTWFEEVFFYRLVVNADDYGRFDARTAILKARLFPLKANVTDKQIEQALCRLATVGLVSTYMVEAKPILQLLTWGKHQTIRNHKSKYPGADDADSTAIEINCMQVNANVPVIQSNPIQSESNPNPDAGNARARAKPPKHRYGEYSNVLLSDEELMKLRSDFPNNWEKLIDRLSGYMQSTGKPYKDHYVTMRNWAKKDAETSSAPMRKVSAQQYRQRSYTESELDSGVTALLEEARKYEQEAMT